MTTMCLPLTQTQEERQQPHRQIFVVVEMGIAGLDSNLNPITQDKTYIRAGQNTMKTGTQRSFSVTGDRYVGDEAQDYCLAHERKYGTGNKVVVNYLYFNILNGKGRKGTVLHYRKL